MESIYAYLNKNKSNINQMHVAFIVAMITNVYSGNYDSFWVFMKAFFDLENFSVVAMWGTLVSLVLFNIIFRILSFIIFNRNEASQLTELMKTKLYACFRSVDNYNGYGWGADRTILTCDNLFEGWPVENILIDEVKTEKFKFVDKKLDEGSELYQSTEDALKITKEQNNNERWMVSEFRTNYNKKNRQVYLSLQKTDWMLNRYFWAKYRGGSDCERQNYIKMLYKKSIIMPNSFCLHLVLITQDDEVIMTEVCNNKKNDYSSTWAATIGEQIDAEDFLDGTEKRATFVYRWVERALKEEFGLYERERRCIIDKESIRVLSLNMEGDIYNLSLLTVVHMNVSFNNFLKLAHTHPESDYEFSDIKVLKIKEIPERLLSEKYKEERECYHPSTEFRLFMCYIHRFGMNSFLREARWIEKKI